MTQTIPGAHSPLAGLALASADRIMQFNDPDRMSEHSGVVDILSMMEHLARSLQRDRAKR
jgi:hypothetical protein